MTMSRRNLLGAAAAALVARPAVLRAAGDPLTIGYVPANAIYWDIHVAIEKGFFREAGFDPQSAVMQSSPQSIQQAIAGTYQIAAAQPEPFIAAVQRGAKALAAFAAPMNRADWCLNVRPEIKSMADLKGKVIGVAGLRNSEIWLTNQLMEQAGLKKGDVDFLVVGTSPAKMTALQKGAIAATILFQPTAELAIREGFPALARYAALRAYPSILFIVDRIWAGTNDNGKRAAAAIRRAHEWLWDPANRAEATAILMRVTKRDQAIADIVYAAYFVDPGIYSRSGEVELSGFDRVLADMAQDGEIVVAPPPPAMGFVLSRELGGMWS